MECKYYRRSNSVAVTAITGACDVDGSILPKEYFSFPMGRPQSMQPMTDEMVASLVCRGFAHRKFAHVGSRWSGRRQKLRNLGLELLPAFIHCQMA